MMLRSGILIRVYTHAIFKEKAGRNDLEKVGVHLLAALHIILKILQGISKEEALKASLQGGRRHIMATWAKGKGMNMMGKVKDHVIRKRP